MGSAAKNSRGEARLGLSATAAAAALYGAVILFGVGPVTPSAAGPEELRSPVVHLPHDSAASGSELRLPQVSPGPDRQPSRNVSTLSGSVIALPASAADETEEGPAPAPGKPRPAPVPAFTPSPSGSPTPAPTASQPPPTEPVITVSAVTVPSITVPPVTVPSVTVPGLTLPPAPELPPLPLAPPLPLP